MPPLADPVPPPLARQPRRFTHLECALTGEVAADGPTEALAAGEGEQPPASDP